MRKLFVIATSLAKGDSAYSDAACASAIVANEADTRVPSLHSPNKSIQESHWEDIVAIQIHQQDFLPALPSGQLGNQGCCVAGVLCLGRVPELGIATVHVQVPTADLLAVGGSHPPNGLIGFAASATRKTTK